MTLMVGLMEFAEMSVSGLQAGHAAHCRTQICFSGSEQGLEPVFSAIALPFPDGEVLGKLMNLDGLGFLIRRMGTGVVS